MAELVTQVSQEQDPAKAAEEARRQAQLIAQKKKEQDAAAAAASSADSESKEEQPHGSCCWRFFCCCFARRPKQRAPTHTTTTTTTATPDGSTGGSSSTGTSGTSGTSTTVAVTTAVPESDGGKTQKFLLPPIAPEHKGKKCLVLDLDETLVHSSFRPVPGPDFIISIELDGVTHRVYVQKRPGVDHFLEQVGARFEVVVFTASLDKYANPVLDILDPKGFVHYRLFREACVQHYGNYVKDLSLLGRRLEDTLIIDNSPFSYMFQPDNAIPITSWFNDKSDRELYDLVPFLEEQIIPAEDVAQIIVERKQIAMSQGGGQVDVGGGEEDEEDEEQN